MNIKQDMKMNVKVIPPCVVLLCLCVLVFSCTKRTLHASVSSFPVSLTADWAAAGVDAPSGTRFHFYPSDGAAFSKDCPGDGFTGLLPAGSYRVLSVSTGASGVSYDGMERYETASVVAQAVGTRADGRIEIAQPSGVYHLPFGELVVLADGEDGGASHRGVPSLLVRTLRLSFTLSDGVELTSFSGRLHGVYTGVLLATGAPTASAVSSAADVYTSFNASLSSGEWGAEISTLGLFNPEHGASYRNMLELDVVTAEGETLTTEANLTDELSEAIRANGGVLPVTLSVQITLSVSAPDQPLHAVATVTGWHNGGSTDADVWE